MVYVVGCFATVSVGVATLVCYDQHHIKFILHTGPINYCSVALIGTSSLLPFYSMNDMMGFSHHPLGGISDLHCACSLLFDAPYSIKIAEEITVFQLVRTKILSSPDL